jgi:hypothetical protein
MRTVYQEWARRREEDPTDDREIHRQALGRVYRESMKTGKFIAATMALRERSHLMGLHVERMELAGPGGGPVRMEVEDVRAEVARKLDRLAAAGAARGAAGKPDPTGS